jgi:hypothetical protein
VISARGGGCFIGTASSRLSVGGVTLMVPSQLRAIRCRKCRCQQGRAAGMMQRSASFDD